MVRKNYQITTYPTIESIEMWIEKDENLTKYFTQFGGKYSTELTEIEGGRLNYSRRIEDSVGSYMSRTISLISLWDYDTSKNQWSCTPLDAIYDVPTLNDVEGTWTSVWPDQTIYSVTISNVSNDAFDITYHVVNDGNTVSDETRTKHLTYNPNEGWYDDENVTSVEFIFDNNTSQAAIRFFTTFGSSLFYVDCFHE